MNTLDPNVFREMFPKFQDLSDTAIELLFKKAEMYIPKDCINEDFIDMIIYETAAHLAQINLSGGVGRVASATQGSVSTSLEYNDKTLGASWWTQTPYGANVWQLISGCYGFEYIPAPYGYYPGYW